MSAEQLSIEEALEAVVKSTHKSFALEEILARIRPLFSHKSRNLKGRVRSLLAENALLFHDEQESVYVPRPVFFKDARFRVNPTAQEIEDGLLFPGHRFMPYCSKRVFPADCIVCLEDGQALERVRVERPLQEVESCFAFMGWQRMVEYFVKDDRANANAVLNEQVSDVPISLSAFDMAATYKKCGFRAGDSFVFAVEDWGAGRLRLAHSPASDIDSNFPAFRKWSDLLEESLAVVFERLGVLTDCYEQIAHALFFGDKFLKKFPGLDLALFVGQSSEVALYPVGINTILWRATERPEDDISLQRLNQDGLMTGEMDSLDSIMRDVGVGLTEREIRSYIMDELRRGGGSVDSLLKRCLAGREIVFYDPKQKHEFYRMLDELWSEVETNYRRFADKPRDECRSRLLEILDAQVAWLRRLDTEQVDPDSLPKKQMLALSQISSALTEMLENLDGPEGELADRMLADLPKTLQKIAVSNAALMEAIDDAVKRD